MQNKGVANWSRDALIVDQGKNLDSFVIKIYERSQDPVTTGELELCASICKGFTVQTLWRSRCDKITFTSKF